MDSEYSPQIDEPSVEEVREALERVVTSSSIRGSPQLATFLRFVVEAVLRGEGSRLKGYTIGIEALGRDASFDPQVDPIVRVEASRLRRSMDRYYADAGADDPIVITLPRGSYIPIFSRRECAAEVPPLAAWRGHVAEISWRRIAAICGGVLALVAVSAITVIAARGIPAVSAEGADEGRDTAVPTIASTPARGNGMPMLYIEPLRVVGHADNAIVSSPTLSERMIDAFARFDTINIVPGPPPTDALGGTRHDYSLSGMIDYGDGRATVALKVVDIAESTVVWSRTFEAAAGQNPVATEEKIIVAAATSLLQSYGVIRARDYARQLTSSDGDPRYRCLLEAANAFRGFDSAAQRRGRICLERLTAADPSFELALPFLALIYYREYQVGLEGPVGDPGMLDAALRTVRQALAMNPMRARAHEVLMLILYRRGDKEAAFAAGEKAIELNRYDMTMVASYGGCKILSGDIVGGLALLRQAGEFWDIRPAWQHFYLFLGHYMSGDMRMAAYEARLLAAENYPLGYAVEVLANAAVGDTGQARVQYDRLVAQYPQWLDPRREFERNVPKSDMAARLAHDLTAAGAGATQ